MKRIFIILVLLLNQAEGGKAYAEPLYVHKVAAAFYAVGMRKGEESASFQLTKSMHLQQQLLQAINTGYFTFVLAKLYEWHLPLALAFIPLLESGYHQQALSPKGASGLWQLMPQTACQLGITPKDSFALNPSTRAALQYFQNLYGEFGNWTLTVAAYHAGKSRVKEALRQRPGAALEELNLPPETKAYVRQFRMLQKLIPPDLL
jgi:hypothetical protein